MFLLTSALLGYIYSPRLDSAPPRWVNFAHGLLLFLYQTFDAVDGKQARRTNSSSPLGELFDHGCDALACAFEALAFGSTAMFGRSTFWFWVISAVPFYFATWEFYFTNTLILPAVNGPTEGLMLIYLAHFFTAIVGSEWWALQFGKSLPFLSWVPILSEIPTNKAVLYLMIAFAVIPTLTFNVSNVHKIVQARKASMLLALAMVLLLSFGFYASSRHWIGLMGISCCFFSDLPFCSPFGWSFGMVCLYTLRPPLFFSLNLMLFFISFKKWFQSCNNLFAGVTCHQLTLWGTIHI
ncbi:choline/ethanolaminephosphotransferase 1-like [Pyrus ussuriensis x Pyrus communis]|uniref:Choline/ethanolaminephosphotransferase 1-like n=1 Tax=Pyrus ussuriensis x Pyrus communis TaxID=2448454 RepID=A0A5N5HY02_9ROSA|nr:choline/ethanolaminephosphotransferase 1-like [Pyrus ussuriensis x Pyrus communis]